VVAHCRELSRTSAALSAAELRAAVEPVERAGAHGFDGGGANPLRPVDHGDRPWRPSSTPIHSSGKLGGEGSPRPQKALSGRWDAPRPSRPGDYEHLMSRWREPARRPSADLESLLDRGLSIPAHEAFEGRHAGSDGRDPPGAQVVATRPQALRRAHRRQQGGRGDAGFHEGHLGRSCSGE
jgi:hypothetical protein